MMKHNRFLSIILTKSWFHISFYNILFLKLNFAFDLLEFQFQGRSWGGGGGSPGVSVILRS